MLLHKCGLSPGLGVADLVKICSCSSCSSPWAWGVKLRVRISSERPIQSTFGCRHSRSRRIQRTRSHSLNSNRFRKKPRVSREILLWMTPSEIPRTVSPTNGCFRSYWHILASCGLGCARCAVLLPAEAKCVRCLLLFVFRSCLIRNVLRLGVFWFPTRWIRYCVEVSYYLF